LTDSSPIVRSESLLGRLVALILFIGLSLGLVLPKLAGAGFLLLSLIAIVWLATHRPFRNAGLDRNEKLLFLAVIVFVGVWVLAWLGHGMHPAGWNEISGIARLLLILPLYLFLRQVNGLLKAWWAGLVTGAVLAGFYAIGFAIWSDPVDWYPRASGPTNPIYFGGIVLAFGVMLLPRLTARDLAAASRLFFALAIVLALTASALSGSRGGWLALPAVLGLYLLWLGTLKSALWRYGLPAAFILVALIITFSPALPMAERFSEGALAVVTLASGETSIEPVGRRWELWKVAFELFRENPLFGVGPGVYPAAVEQHVMAGWLPPVMIEYNHPHNQYLSALLVAGLPGLLSLILLFLLPATRGLALLRSGLETTREVGWCGLAIMTIFAIMAFSESLFERNIGIVWFALFAAVIPALARSGRREALSGHRPVRQHSLSVIMISKNEADRIEFGLKSVHKWADEIVVLDSGSTDTTVEICRRYTDKVEVTDWPGFGAQKQRALERAAGTWVLSLDADEVVSDELKTEIDTILSGQGTVFAGYRLPWSTRAFGGHLQFGRWTRAPLRLFLRKKGRFTDVAVHEKVVLDGEPTPGLLEGPLHHDVFRDLRHAQAKLSYYARLQSRERYDSGKRCRWPGPWLRAMANFVDNYFINAAFLDGRPGWTMSWLYAWYTFEKYQQLRRLGRNPPKAD